MPGIELENLCFAYRLAEEAEGSHFYRRRFKQRAALKNVTLSFKEGDIVGLIGKNGGGKSTLLKILSGSLQPTAGKIDVEGEVLSLLDRYSGIMPNCTLYENAKLKAVSLGLNRKPEIEQFISSCMADSKLEDRLHEPLRNLSTGMAGRYNLALNTQIVKSVTILDEWISTLDAQSSGGKGMLDRLVNEADIVVLASHNRELIERICNKVVVIDEGKVVYAGRDTERAYRFLDTEINGRSLPESVVVRKDRKPILHCLRISKTAGCALESVLEQAKSERYNIRYHSTTTRLKHLPAGEKVCFFYRDPVERFARSFITRLQKGAPVRSNEWNDYERAIFSVYTNPDQLATDISSADSVRMMSAFHALQRIGNVNRPMTDWLTDLNYLETRCDDILFAGDANLFRHAIPAFCEKAEIPFDKLRLEPDVEAFLARDFRKDLSEQAITNLRHWYDEDILIAQWLKKYH